MLDDFGFGSIGLKKSDFMSPDKMVQLGVLPVRVDIITSILVRVTRGNILTTHFNPRRTSPPEADRG